MKSILIIILYFEKKKYIQNTLKFITKQIYKMIEIIFLMIIHFQRLSNLILKKLLKLIIEKGIILVAITK